MQSCPEKTFAGKRRSLKIRFAQFKIIMASKLRLLNEPTGFRLATINIRSKPTLG